MPDGYTIYRRSIDVAPGRPLGRHVHHDSRSLAYPWKRSGAPVANVLHARRIAILDQGDVGSCTGNAEVGALGSDPIYATLAHQATPLDEAEALKLYSAAETIDGDGPFPPQDNGSSGLSVCQAARNAGLISGYVHCFSLADVLDALQKGPVIVGVNWYDSFDSPGSGGLLTISKGAQVRGGHELVLRGASVADRMLRGDNSWGDSWGDKGSFCWSWDTMTRLLGEEGDGTVSIPLTQPAPVPVPPVPVPDPGPLPPMPPPVVDDADRQFAITAVPWVSHRHCGINKVMQRVTRAWLQEKGLL